MMGGGKTRVGQCLSLRLEVPFADSDEAIVRNAGRTIRELFEQDGEAAFRAREYIAIEQLLAGPAGVIAAGGGAFAMAATRELILRRSRSIWLDVPVERLAERLAAAEDRPLLDRHDPNTCLAALAAARRPFHALADLRIDGDADPDIVAERIERALNELGR